MPDASETPQLPHGIMGLQPQPFPWTTMIPVGLGLVLLGLLGWFLWQRRHAKAASPLPSGAVAVRDPWAVWDQTLNALVAAEPWNREACENFFFRLSFVLREALELRTSVPVTGQTLAETRRSLEKNPALSANFQEELLKFLSLADQLKFAGQWLSAAESMAWREKVKTWMEELRRDAFS